MAKLNLGNIVLNTARSVGQAVGTYQKARDQILRKPDFVSGLAQSSQWAGGSLGNVEQAQLRAARNNWFYTGVNMKALDLASAKMDLYFNPSGLEDEGEKAEGHPFLGVLRRPNPYMGRSLLMQYTQWWMDLQGESFWFIEPDGREGIKGLWPLPSNAMDIKFKPDFKSIDYYILKVTRWYEIDPRHIIHFKYPNPWDFFRGLPPLIAFMLTVDADLAMKMYNGAFFGADNVMPSAVISLGTGDAQELFDQKDIDAIKNDLHDNYSAIKRKTIVTNANTMSVAMLGYNNKDMDFLAGMEMNKEEILWALGIPAGMMDKNSTEANAKVGNKIFKDNMWGTKTLIADEITNQGLHEFYSEDLEARFEDDRVYDREAELKEAVIAKDAMPREMWAEKYFDVTLKPGEVTMTEEAQNKQMEAKQANSAIKAGGKPGEKKLSNSKATSNTNPNMTSKSAVEMIGVPAFESYKLPTIMLKDLTSNMGQRTEQAMQSLREWIGKHGIEKPIVCKYEDGKLSIIDGKHRVVCANELGIEQISVIVYNKDGTMIDPIIPYSEWLANGATNTIKDTKSITEELEIVKNKARNYFKSDKIKSLKFSSTILEGTMLDAMIEDLKGAEQKADIDFIMDHWVERFLDEVGNLKGGAGSGNFGHAGRDEENLRGGSKAGSVSIQEANEMWFDSDMSVVMAGYSAGEKNPQSNAIDAFDKRELAKLKQASKVLQEAAQENSGETILYRGVAYNLEFRDPFNEFQIGEEYTFDRLTATSTMEDVARGYSDGQYAGMTEGDNGFISVMMQIENPNGIIGYKRDNVEVVLPAGSKFFVTDMHEDASGKLVVRLYSNTGGNKKSIETIKAYSWRPWSGFESDLISSILNGLQSILNLFISNASDSASTMNMMTDSWMWSQAEKILRDSVTPLFQDIASKAAADISAQLGSSQLLVSYDVTNQMAREWARVYAAEQVKDITETTRKALQIQIDEWIAAGRDNNEGIEALQRRIMNLKGENGLPLFGEERAEMIAQSEATSVYAGGTERTLVENGYPPTVYKPRAHVRCRCYLQPGRLKDMSKVIVWYTARDEMVCLQDLDTPFGQIKGCRHLHRIIVSEGHAGEKFSKEQS